MKTGILILTCITGFVLSSSCLSQGFCVVVNGGCRDITDGKLYIQVGNQLVDPETKRVYMDIPPEPTTRPRVTICRPGNSSESGIPINPTTGRPYPVVFRVNEPDAAVDTSQKLNTPDRRSRSAVPPDEFQSHSGPQNLGARNFGPSPSAIDTQTGQFYPGVAGGVINPTNGQFYPDVGAGYIDPRSGQFMPKQ